MRGQRPKEYGHPSSGTNVWLDNVEYDECDGTLGDGDMNKDPLPR